MSSPAGPPDWITRWQRIARRIRVPLGFLTAALYLYELSRRAPLPAAVAWSLVLVLPGLWLRALRVRICKKESGAYDDRPLRLHAQPVVPRVHVNRCRLCRSSSQLAGGTIARRVFPGDLRPGYRVGRTLPPRYFPWLRSLLPPRPPVFPPFRLRRGARGRSQRPLCPGPVPEAPRVQCSFGRTAAVP